MEKEFILCAALHYQDNKVYQEQPINIKTGIVVCGRRHNNCYMTLLQLKDDLDANLITKDSMGFITSLDRFVSRAEAFVIAKENNQFQFGLSAVDSEHQILISENLY